LPKNKLKVGDKWQGRQQRYCCSYRLVSEDMPFEDKTPVDDQLNPVGEFHVCK
jgi:DNA-directed RNA polymerase beta subunit